MVAVGVHRQILVTTCDHQICNLLCFPTRYKIQTCVFPYLCLNILIRVGCIYHHSCWLQACTQIRPMSPSAMSYFLLLDSSVSHLGQILLLHSCSCSSCSSCSCLFQSSETQQISVCNPPPFCSGDPMEPRKKCRFAMKMD